MDERLHPAFVEFGRSGRRYSRAEVMAIPPGTFTAELSEIDVADIGEGVALLTYRSAFDAPGAPVEFANRSSIWVRTDGVWRLRFHQGTPCPDWR